MAGRFDHLLPVYTPEELSIERWALCKLNGRIFYNYGISNLGRVLNTTTQRLLKPQWVLDSRQIGGVYWRVYLYDKPNEWTRCLIHLLVAERFVEGRSKTDCIVHHKDHQTHNPRWWNLEWTTLKKNAQYYQQMRREKEAYERLGIEGDGHLASIDYSIVEPITYEPAPF